MKTCRIRSVVNLLLFLLPWHAAFSQNNTSPQTQPGEIIYHVFQRSFYDSNGDGQGDFNGLRQQLPYLKELGVTSLLLLPVFASDYYHNYFANDFEALDPSYGTKEEFIRLVQEVHRIGMKLYLDMEMQYVTEKHAWWKESVGKPEARFADYITYEDSARTKPASIIFGLTTLTGYDNKNLGITTVNLLNREVFDYTLTIFSFYADPNGDGDFQDGVDGFRLDHAMDDLDWKGIQTGLFEKFWQPLISRLKKKNPALVFLAEQADWNSYGWEYMEKAGADKVFAFNLQKAILTFHKDSISSKAEYTLNKMPGSKSQIVFLENHDLDRFASLTGKSAGKARAGAALNLLLGGTPLIYYGQEIGMYGTGGFGKFGNTDANDIPRREAFEWYKNLEGPGMATWYKNSGPWWDNTNLKAGEGISLEEQRTEPTSVWNYYRSLIKLRQANESLHSGRFMIIPNKNHQVLSYLRITEQQTALVAVNLSGKPQQVMLERNTINEYGKGPVRKLFGDVKLQPATEQLSILLPAYETGVWDIGQR